MKIAVLLSGGVDSSVALALLKEQGHDITAFYLKIWLEDELSFLGQCPWEDDLSYAKAVCSQFDVPLKIIPLQREYYAKVVTYALEELKEGRTPSPDIFCNKYIKFGAFFDHIDKSFDSFDKVASGHYACLEEKDGIVLMKNSPDPVKDQTYFLAHLSQKQLQRILFPVGGYLKEEVRQIAEKYDLANKKRKDSQGICFLGKIKYKDFVKHHLGDREGWIIEQSTGKKLGKHHGYWYHTIGQRQGLGLSGGPWYVVDKDLKKNIIYVSLSYNKEQYARNEYIVSHFNWLADWDDPTGEVRIKIRHGPQFYHGVLTFLPKQSEDEPLRGHVRIQETDTGIAPGQFSVFYKDNLCLGCAKIIETVATK